MLGSMFDPIKEVLGLDLKPDELGTLQICLRGFVVFVYAIILVRLGAKRFLARMTAIDAILGFILASTLSRAINGAAPFVSSLAVCIVLVLTHRILSWLAVHSKAVGNMVKGREQILVENGVLNKNLMQQHLISEADLAEELRLNGSICSPEEVKQATLERSGQISVVKRKD
ncbi:MAG: putative rane protein [Verrucomicrobiales bacterium]|nr:putative rane protein [Verrucomicrobiales bacterium]